MCRTVGFKIIDNRVEFAAVAAAAAVDNKCQLEDVQERKREREEWTRERIRLRSRGILCENQHKKDSKQHGNEC